MKQFIVCAVDMLLSEVRPKPLTVNNTWPSRETMCLKKIINVMKATQTDFFK